MTNWKKRYEQTHTAELWLRDRREIELAEWRGLEDYAHAILKENRALWQDWENERQRTQQLQRKVAKLTKRLKKQEGKP